MEIFSLGSLKFASKAEAYPSETTLLYVEGSLSYAQILDYPQKWPMTVYTL
jgi:hypothetical protein